MRIGTILSATIILLCPLLGCATQPNGNARATQEVREAYKKHLQEEAQQVCVAYNPGTDSETNCLLVATYAIINRDEGSASVSDAQKLLNMARSDPATTKRLADIIVGKFLAAMSGMRASGNGAPQAMSPSPAPAVVVQPNNGLSVLDAVMGAQMIQNGMSAGPGGGR